MDKTKFYQHSPKRYLFSRIKAREAKRCGRFTPLVQKRMQSRFIRAHYWSSHKLHKYNCLWVLYWPREKKSAWRCGAGGRIQAQAVQCRIIQVFCFVPAEHNDRWPPRERHGWATRMPITGSRCANIQPMRMASGWGGDRARGGKLALWAYKTEEKRVFLLWWSVLGSSESFLMFSFAQV